MSDDNRMNGDGWCDPMMPTMMQEDDGMVGEGGDLEDSANSMDSFSGFLDPGGRFASANKSVHYHHWSCFCLSNGYSCHGCVKQDSLKENF